MNLKKYVFIALVGFCTTQTTSQITKRERPAAWNDLILGGRFMDRFQPIQPLGPLTSDTWGADNVKPRYIENGIEDNEWSYWGGNAVLGDDGKYHLFVCRWREDSEKGHGEWHNSIVVHAVSDTSFGPYKVVQTIGPGHNPELFQLKDGRYVVYVIDGRYIANGLNGPWEYSKFDFDQRDRPIIEGLSNLTFAQREDGSYLMVCRGGGIWLSKDGISPYNQVTGKRVYPPVEGRFEDPLVWRTNIQYHLVVNDWLGRIAYYLRSKDGMNWKVDPGEAYLPGITKYTDGTDEDWFKYERIKMLQDSLGRATQAHFAVIDVLKKEDKGGDNHSSKHITIPLTAGRQILLLNEDKITAETKTIQIKIKAENGFDPHADIDLNSLRFGASEEVNFGRGSKIIETKSSAKDLIITFDGYGNGLNDANFVAKLLGKTNQGKLLFGYARLPWVDYLEPMLSARMPVFSSGGGKNGISVEVENFGQVISEPSDIKMELSQNKQIMATAKGNVPVLKPFERTKLNLNLDKAIETGEEYDVKTSILSKAQNLVLLHGRMK